MGLLTIATVSGPRGVKGEVKLYPTDSPPNWLDHISKVKFTLPGREQWMTVTRWQWKTPHVWAFFEEIPTREIAATWSKALVEVDECSLPPLPVDTYRAQDLVGKTVWYTKTQQPVAVVESLMFNGDSAYLQLKHDEQTWLMPFLMVFIPTIEADKIWINLDLADLS